MAIYDVSTNEKKASPSLVAGGTLYADSPVGTILPFGGSNPPSGFLFCQGQEVSKTTYSELYSVIGDSFGTASDATKFVIPDMRESVPKGAGLTGHTVGAHLDADGLAVGEFLDDRVQSHTHSAKASATPGQNGTGVAILLGNTDTSTGANTGRRGDTTEVKSVGVNYIIKAKMIGVPADFMAKVDEAMADMFLVVNDAVDATGTIAANQDLRIDMPTPPSGYKYFCCDLKGTGEVSVYPRVWSSEAVFIHNTSTVSKQYQLNVDITYIKE